MTEGQLVRPASVSEHQIESFTPEQMLELAGKYDKEMKAASEHAENQRILAYRSRDLIRMTCIDDKLTQMMVVIKLAEPRLRRLGGDQGDLLVMRQHFSIVAAGARSGRPSSRREVDQCMGDNLGTVSAGRIKEEATPETDNVFDPTRPRPRRTTSIDRAKPALPLVTARAPGTGRLASTPGRRSRKLGGVYVPIDGFCCGRRCCRWPRCRRGARALLAHPLGERAIALASPTLAAGAAGRPARAGDRALRAAGGVSGHAARPARRACAWGRWGRGRPSRRGRRRRT